MGIVGSVDELFVARIKYYRELELRGSAVFQHGRFNKSIVHQSIELKVALHGSSNSRPNKERKAVVVKLD
jgi:hypothetical protein